MEVEALMSITHCEVPGQRSPDQIITAAQERASALRKARDKRWMLTVVAFLAIGIAAAGVDLLSPSAGSNGLPSGQNADASGRIQPPSVPVGAGWSAAEPAVAPSIVAQYGEWMPLITSSLKVFEHMTQGDKTVALRSIDGNDSQSLNLTQGPHAGSSVTIESLDGLLSARGATWTMAATSQQPFNEGGAVTFLSQTGDVVLVSLVGSPSNPYSATVARWSNGLAP
jgi:hypothetical protein